MDKFNVLKTFITVCEKGSFAAAAAVLGTDASTVSKAISRLEKQLAYTLFYRSTRKLTITDAGKEYLETVRTLLIDLDECEQRLKSGNESATGILKVNLPVAYGRLYIVPLLSKFAEQYPDISLQLSFSDEYVDIIERGIDLSIRTGTVSDSRMVLHKLSPMDFLTCASRNYLMKFGPIDSFQDFDNHRWIRFRFKQTGKLMPILAEVDGETEMLDPKNDLVVDDGQALVDLCRNGVGVMQGPHFLFKDGLSSGDLVSLFPPIEPEGYGVYLLYPKRDFLPRKVAVFTEFLKAELDMMGEGSNYCWSSEVAYLNEWE
ncbi:LysR substrate-binding domain-containing protein [Neptuniibacter sp. PT34_22]|uniref:LysR family transcriptional regulator n=1 Tax=Neptuniibacter sp. PT34_22 TaxID=3398205 RepID=UPI0039F517BD